MNREGYFVYSGYIYWLIKSFGFGNYFGIYLIEWMEESTKPKMLSFEASGTDPRWVGSCRKMADKKIFLTDHAYCEPKGQLHHGISLILRFNDLDQIVDTWLPL